MREPGKVSDQMMVATAADEELDPDPGEDGELTRSDGIEDEDVGGVGVEGGSEVNEQEAHLGNFAAVVLAGEAVTKFVDGPEKKHDHPKRPDVVGAFARKGIEGGGIGGDAVPVAGEDAHGHDEERNGNEGEGAGIHPAQIGIEASQSFVGIPGFEGDVEKVGMIDAAFALVADTFEDGEIFFADGFLPEVGIDAIEEFEDVLLSEGGGWILLGHVLSNFSGSASAVAGFEEAEFEGAVAVVGKFVKDFYDVTGFAQDLLFADAEVVTEFRAVESFGEDAGELKAGGAEAHGEFSVWRISLIWELKAPPRTRSLRSSR